ncbi:MAG: hypothetical protein H6825_04000 [Planctomycetes bacterium]|nr:hypothetical protein [Planctomycetota bacterium]
MASASTAARDARPALSLVERAGQPAPADLASVLATPRDLQPQKLELPARDAPADRAALTPKQEKKLAKLAKKWEKLTAKVESRQDLVTEAENELAAAQAALDAAEAMSPITIWEWLDYKKAHAAALKAVKKWTKLLAKRSKQLAKAEQQLSDTVADIEDIDPDYFASESDPGDDGGDGSGGDPLSSDVSVPILVQEALPKETAGTTRTAAVATFGLPFSREQAVPLVDGRPALAVSGADRYQFEVLDTWYGDDTVRWALVHVQTDVAASQITQGLTVVAGDGSSGQADLVSNGSGGTLVIDTGPLQATIKTVGFNLFKKVVVDGTTLVDSNADGLTGRSLEGDLLTPSDDTEVVVEENGPAHAVIRATGSLTTVSGDEPVDFTCRIVARAGSRDLEVQFTVRNARFDRRLHAQLESIELSVPGSLGTGRTAAVSLHDGVHEQSLGSNEDATLFMAHTSAQVEGLGSVSYVPHLPLVDGSLQDFVYEGYEVAVGSSTVHAFGDKTLYPAEPYVDLTGSKGGVTVAIENLAFLWPGTLEAHGDGTVVAGLFPGSNPAPFVFSFKQHESRTAVFSFHKGAASAPEEVPERLDHPLAGRAADYLDYDRARVFPYRLVSEDEENEAYADMGLGFHHVVASNDGLSVTRYLYKGTTGGSNNHARIERLIGCEWLRHGGGGNYLTGLDLALYKSEWQIQRSDDFHDLDDFEATNPEVENSWGHFGDDEHRYRDGIILAYYLTGDRRYRDAMLDECEVLQNVDLWPHERSMYQTLRAMGLTCEFVSNVAPQLEDPDDRAYWLGQVDVLTQILRDRLEYICTPIKNVDTATSGFGWQSAPGTGSRRYYVNSADNKDEKPDGENFQCRGFISASLGPLGYYHAARWLAELAERKGPSDPDYADLVDEAERARARMRDLTYWTREELFPYKPNPVDRHLVYSYAVTLKQWTITESYDFHPIQLGMGECFIDPNSGDSASERKKYMDRAIEQFEAHAAHDNGPYNDNLYLLDTRLDVQHFMRIYLDSL